MDEFFARNQALRARVLTPFRHDLGRLETPYYARFNVLKRQFRTVNEVINENPGLKDKQIQSLVDLIQVESNFNTTLASITRTRPEDEAQSSSWADRVKRWTGLEKSGLAISQSLLPIDDIRFMRELAAATEFRPVYCDAAAEIKSEVIDALKRKLQKICGQSIHMIKESIRQNMETEIARHFTTRQLHEEKSLWQTLRIGMQKFLSSSQSMSRFVIFDNV